MWNSRLFTRLAIGHFSSLLLLIGFAFGPLASAEDHGQTPRFFPVIPEEKMPQFFQKICETDKWMAKLRADLPESDWRKEIRSTMEEFELKDVFWNTFLQKNYAKPGFVASYCKIRERYLRKQIEAGMTPDAVLDKLSNDETQLFVLGEKHPDMNGKDLYGDIMKTLKEKTKGGLKYLFLEMSAGKGMQAAIDNYLVGKMTFDELAKSQFSSAGKASEPMYRAAKELGLKIVCVDREVGDWRNEGNEFTGMAHRNETMADNMVGVLEKDPKAKGLFIVGQNHVAPSRIPGTRMPVPVQVLVAEKKIKTKTVQILRPPVEHVLNELTPPDCTWAIYKPEMAAFGFLPGADSKFLVSYPPSSWDLRGLPERAAKQNRASHWNDFDAVLYFPRK